MAGRNGGPPAILVGTFDSNSRPGAVYEVRISRQDGRMYCTCRGWTNRKHCKHVDLVTKGEILDALERACLMGVLGV